MINIHVVYALLSVLQLTIFFYLLSLLERFNGVWTLSITPHESFILMSLLAVVLFVVCNNFSRLVNSIASDESEQKMRKMLKQVGQSSLFSMAILLSYLVATTIFQTN